MFPFFPSDPNDNNDEHVHFCNSLGYFFLPWLCSVIIRRLVRTSGCTLVFFYFSAEYHKHSSKKLMLLGYAKKGLTFVKRISPGDKRDYRALVKMLWKAKDTPSLEKTGTYENPVNSGKAQFWNLVTSEIFLKTVMKSVSIYPLPEEIMWTPLLSKCLHQAQERIWIDKLSGFLCLFEHPSFWKCFFLVFQEEAARQAAEISVMSCALVYMRQPHTHTHATCWSVTYVWREG